jgi:acetyl/propionyl-CoA carboxylase alpha subunit
VPDRYDPMLAKLIARGETRDEALARLRDALDRLGVAGVATNRPWLIALLDDSSVREGRYSTHTAGAIPAPAPSAPTRGAVAALVAATLERPATDDPWERIGPFRLSGATELAFHGIDGDWESVTTVERAGEGWTLCVDDECEPLTWWTGPDGVWTLRLGDDAARIAIVRRDDGTFEVASAEGRWQARPGRRPAVTTRSAARSDGSIRAPLPGKVLRVETEPGAEVAEGEPLVILSAMKIEVVLRAPRPGRVRAVHCRADEQVDAGALLVEITPEVEE